MHSFFYFTHLRYLCTMNNNTNKTMTDNITLPKSYIFCFQSDCPKSKDCVCFFAGQHLDDRKICTTVLPEARKDGSCEYYKKTRTINGAWGFDKLFADVKAKDAPTLRKKIKDYLGGNGTYYQFHHGIRLLSPEQQQWIISLFKHYGYTGKLKFDDYRDVIDW